MFLYYYVVIVCGRQSFGRLKLEYGLIVLIDIAIKILLERKLRLVYDQLIYMYLKEYLLIFLFDLQINIKFIKLKIMINWLFLKVSI